MVAMVQTAYDRSVAARDLTSPPGATRIVINTFNSYFGITPADGKDYRVENIIGNFLDDHFWHYGTDEFNSRITL